MPIITMPATTRIKEISGAFGALSGYGVFQSFSLSAFMALNGELNTTVDGTRELINSIDGGSNVSSTSGQMLDFPEGEHLSYGAVQDVKAYFFTISPKSASSSFQKIVDIGASFSIIKNGLFSLYYDSIYHDTNLSLVNGTAYRIAIVTSSFDCKLYVNKELYATFEKPLTTFGNYYRSRIMEGANGLFGDYRIFSSSVTEEQVIDDFDNLEESLLQRKYVSEYLEEVTIPTYSASEPTHMLVNETNGFWNNIDMNRTDIQHYYVEAGSYSTKVSFTRSGTATNRRTISLHSSSLHPSSLLEAEQANIRLSMDGASYLTFDRISNIDETEAYSTSIKFTNGSSNNIFNMINVENFNYGVSLVENCNYNVFQKSYFNGMSVDGIMDDNVAINIRSLEGTKTIGNKCISNDFRNCNDAFQTTRKDDNYNISADGLILDDNNMWMDGGVYTDGTYGNEFLADGTTPNPNYLTFVEDGEYMIGENAIDLKYGSLNSSDPMIITNNRMWGYHKGDSTTGGDFSTDVGALAVFHFGIDNVKMNYNLMFDSQVILGCSGTYTTIPYAGKNIELSDNIIADVYQNNPTDLDPYPIYFYDSENIKFNRNTLVRFASNTTHGGNSVNMSSVINGEMKGNVLVDVQTPTGTNTDGSNTDNNHYECYDVNFSSIDSGLIADAELEDISFEYERYTTAPKIKTVDRCKLTSRTPNISTSGARLVALESVGMYQVYPMTEGTGVPSDIISNTPLYTQPNHADIEASWNLGSGLSNSLQKIYFNDDMTKANTMNADITQIITTVPTEAYSIKVIGTDDVVYIYTDDMTTQTIWIDEVSSPSTPLIGNIEMNEVATLFGITELKSFEVTMGLIKS